MSMLFKRIKDWATSITAFRTGDVIPVDGPDGTAKMSKDTLLALTAQNAELNKRVPKIIAWNLAGVHKIQFGYDKTSHTLTMDRPSAASGTSTITITTEYGKFDSLPMPSNYSEVLSADLNDVFFVIDTVAESFAKKTKGELLATDFILCFISYFSRSSGTAYISETNTNIEYVGDIVINKLSQYNFSEEEKEEILDEYGPYFFERSAVLGSSTFSGEADCDFHKGDSVRFSLSGTFTKAYFSVVYGGTETAVLILQDGETEGFYTFTEDCKKWKYWLNTGVPGETMKVTCVQESLKVKINRIEDEVKETNADLAKIPTNLGVYNYEKSETMTGGFFQGWAICSFKKGDRVRFSITGTFNIAYINVTYNGVEERAARIADGDTFADYIFTGDCDAWRWWMDGCTIGSVMKMSCVQESVRDKLDRIGNDVDALDLGKGRSIGVIGDSYSTYYGWMPSGNPSYYAKWGVDGENGEPNNVDSVTDQWWYKLCEQIGFTLLMNDSWSGSSVCNFAYGVDKTASSFVTRMKNSFGEQRATQPKPDILFVFGGTNDSWGNANIGQVKYSGWTTEDLNDFLPAACYMFDYLKKWNPGCRIINIVNNGLSSGITDGFATVCEHYGIVNVVLDNITKESSHPNKTGFTQIAQQIKKFL